jgi:uncharacterized protein (TIGR02246 family)
MTASRAGDLTTVLELMTEDVVFMVPGREPFGKAEFGRGFGAMRDVRIDGRSDIQEVRVLGEWAFLRNHLEITATPANGTPVHRTGYVLTILRKEQDGRWRLARDANLLT